MGEFKKFIEAYMDSFKYGDEIVEIYKNPTHDELAAATKQFGWSPRCLITDSGAGDIYMTGSTIVHNSLMRLVGGLPCATTIQGHLTDNGFAFSDSVASYADMQWATKFSIILSRLKKNTHLIALYGKNPLITDYYGSSDDLFGLKTRGDKR